MIRKVSIFRRTENRGKLNWTGCLQEVSACFKLVVENKVYFQYKYKKKEKWFPCLLEETWSFGLLQTSFMWVQRNPRPGLCWSTGLRDKLQVIFCQINNFSAEIRNTQVLQVLKFKTICGNLCKSDTKFVILTY